MSLPTHTLLVTPSPPPPREGTPQHHWQALRPPLSDRRKQPTATTCPPLSTALPHPPAPRLSPTPSPLIPITSPTRRQLSRLLLRQPRAALQQPFPRSPLVRSSESIASGLGRI
jgi:hypothetical protein